MLEKGEVPGVDNVSADAINASVVRRVTASDVKTNKLN